MTNKVKPFFIRITDDMTPQMVQDAFDKCVDTGANVGDCVSGITQKYEYESSYTINTFKFFGVTGSHVFNSTRFYMKEIDFGKTAQEITLDQLDEWLGLEVKHEWKNGDKCMAFGVECTFIGKSHLNDCDSVVMMKNGTLKHYQTNMLSNPNEGWRKDELESAYDIYSHAQHSVNVIGYDTFEEFKQDPTKMRFYLAIVDKTGYRKQ